MGANGSGSQKTALKVLTSCLMPHGFIVEAKPLECGSAPEVRRAAAAFAAIANTGIRPKAAAALPHSKAPFGRSLAFDSHFRLHPQGICIWTHEGYYESAESAVLLTGNSLKTHTKRESGIISS
jgi:hypothetical protein